MKINIKQVFLTLVVLLTTCCSCSDQLKEVPTTFFHPMQYEKKYKVISYNILEGMKLDKGKNKFVEWVKNQDPDILALQEANHLTETQLLSLAKRYGHEKAIILKEKGYPVALTAKADVKINNVYRFTEGFTHGFIHLEIDNINYIILHLDPHSSEQRKIEIHKIFTWINRNPSKKDWIIMGDFNSSSPLDKNILGPNIDYTLHEYILDNEYVDVVKIFNSKFTQTVPTKEFMIHPKDFNRYDFIYISKSLKNKVYSSSVIYDEFTDVYSDHYPIQLEIYKY